MVRATKGHTARPAPYGRCRDASGGHEPGYVGVEQVRDLAQHEQTLALINRINDRVGTYLLMKTMINTILGLQSYVVLLVLSE